MTKVPGIATAVLGCALGLTAMGCGKTGQGGVDHAPSTARAPVRANAATASAAVSTDHAPGAVEDGGVASETTAKTPATASFAPGPARDIPFEWCPSTRAAASYAMEDLADRHRIVLTPGVETGGRYPVVVAFHGQPKRGRDPRDYWFVGHVRELVVGMVEKGEIEPVILVLPVFRFEGGNWPWMNPAKLRAKVEELLAAKGVEGGAWYAFGHSGAAGCGGGGLNQAHLMRPAAVGFFDTCLGKGWKEALVAAREAGIRVLDVHSVETAGFEPRQTPEYQASFDFSRAFAPVGLAAVECGEKHPGARLRDQRFACAATPDGLAKAFVIDAGEGAQAHQAMVEPAVRYFLTSFAGLRARGRI